MLRLGPDPVAPPAPSLPDDLVGEVIAAFQPYYPDPISRERGRAMTRNLGDVLLMLDGWKREDEAAAAGPNAIPPEPTAVPAPPRQYRPKRRKFPAEVP